VREYVKCWTSIPPAAVNGLAVIVKPLAAKSDRGPESGPNVRTLLLQLHVVLLQVHALPLQPQAVLFPVDVLLLHPEVLPLPVHALSEQTQAAPLHVACAALNQPHARPLRGTSVTCTSRKWSLTRGSWLRAFERSTGTSGASSA